MGLKVGLLGATFDPIHFGHLQPALAAIETLSLNEVWLVPNRSPYYKAEPIATDQQRWDMVQLAVEAYPQLKACDHELRQATYSYTTTTLQRLKQLYPEVTFYFLMGMDSFCRLPAWYDWQSLPDLAHLVIYRRPATEIYLTPVLEAWLKDKHGILPPQLHTSVQAARIHVIEVPQVAASSTCLRQHYADHKNVLPDNLPSSVHAYIMQHQIYG
ncbi:MAG: nicotinate (nicotinamide) nucleotide adenylyltransferase [Shewanellaceae bacterium]|nr:nicotinate (nicotinamide) nucleotide adenylyltransferase [Shewanellaceae bacterium]